MESLKRELINEITKIPGMNLLRTSKELVTRNPTDSEDLWISLAIGTSNDGLIPNYPDSAGIIFKIHPDFLVIYNLNATSPEISGGQIIQKVVEVLRNSSIDKTISVHNDWSDGFWEHMKEKYPDITWYI